MSFSQIVARVADLARAHASNVELAVFGNNDEVQILPNKKQQLQVLNSISSNWGEFPLDKPSPQPPSQVLQDDHEIQRLTSNFHSLPCSFQTAFLINALAGYQTEPDALVSLVLDLFLAMLVEHTVKVGGNAALSDELARQVQAKLLGLQKPCTSGKWYWYELETKLVKQSVGEWTRVLRKFSFTQAAEFLSLSKLQFAMEFLPTAASFCLELNSPLCAASLLFWLNKALDVQAKREILEILVLVLVQHPPQEFDMQLVVDVLTQKSPAQELKPARRQLECWFLCHNRDLAWETWYKDFALKRVVKPLRTNFATSLDFAYIALKGRAMQVKPKLAKLVLAELTLNKQCKRLLDSVDYSGAVFASFGLAELCQYDLDILPQLLVKAKSRMLIGLLTLRELQQREQQGVPASVINNLVDTAVLPHLLSIDAVPKRKPSLKPKCGPIKRTYEGEWFFDALGQLLEEEDPEQMVVEEVALEVVACLDLLANSSSCTHRLSCEYLRPNKFPLAVRQHCVRALQRQVQRGEFEMRIIQELKGMVVDSRGALHTHELIQVLQAVTVNKHVVHVELAGLALALAAIQSPQLLQALRQSVPYLDRTLGADGNELVGFIFASPFARECARILSPWNLHDDALTVRILLACDPSRVALEDFYFGPCLSNKRSLDDLQVCSAAGYSAQSVVSVLRRVVAWFRQLASTNSGGGAMFTSLSAASISSATLPSNNNNNLPVSASPLLLSTPSSFAASTLRTSLRFAAATVSTPTAPPKLVPVVLEDFAEEKVLMRCVCQTLSMMVAGKASTAIPEQLLVAAAAVETVNLLLSRFANKQRRQVISSLLVADLCAVVLAICDLVSSSVEPGEVDATWKRVDRRILWIFLRRIAGFEERPFAVASEECREWIETAATRLLSIGPVSLGQICEPPDSDLFCWIVSSPKVAKAFLNAHFLSVIEYYITKCISNHPLLFPQVLESVREHFDMDFERGRGPQMIDPIPLSLRVHLLALALLMPSFPGKISDRQLGGLICMAVSREGPDNYASAAATFAELCRMFLDDDNHVQDVQFVSRWCAKHCAATLGTAEVAEMAQLLVEMLWEHCRVDLSLPWVCKLKHGVLVDKAWDLPFAVWKAFPNKLASMRHIVAKKTKDGGGGASRRRALLAQVGSVATCPDFLIIFNDHADNSDLVCDALVIKGFELLQYCALDSARDFVKLGNFAFACPENRFTAEYLRWVQTLTRTQPPPPVVGDADQDKDQLLDWAVSILVQHVPHTTLTSWLDDVLGNLDSGGGHAEDYARQVQLLRLYCALRKHGVAPESGRHNELILITFASQRTGKFEAFQVCIEYLSPPPGDGGQGEPALLLDATLAYLGEIWSGAQPLLFNLALERSAVQLFDRLRLLSGVARGDDHHVDLFWIAFERFLRIHLGEPRLFYYATTTTATGTGNNSELFQLMRLLAQGNSELQTALRLFQDGGNHSSETALFVCFQVAKETRSEHLLQLVLENASAREEIAHLCAKEVILSTFGYSPRLVACAATLLQRFPQLPPSSSASSASLRSMPPYRGPQPASAAMERAEAKWTLFALDYRVQYWKESVPLQQHVGDDYDDHYEAAVAMLSQSPPASLAAAGKAAPVDIRDVLTGDARARLVAHAMDRGVFVAKLSALQVVAV
ncbi:hypothetical protein BASA81_012113 [Batrachochytrium salamandrivorans]|nr:hypothetical protein BASA81_012113 [Batrachochytrium salamandrivorans]